MIGRQLSKHRIRRPFLAGVILAATLLGCNPIATLTPASPPQSLMEAVTPIPTATPWQTPVAQPSASTVAPGSTKAAASTALPAVPTSTPDLKATVMAIGQPRVSSSLLSPDGQWRFNVVIYDCSEIRDQGKIAYEQLQLVRMTDGAEKIADSQLRYCEGLGSFGLAGLFWSPNSWYFYYTDTREGVPDGGGCSFWERSIIRVDVTTLDKERLGGGPVSPDGTRLATTQRTGPDAGKGIVIGDINGGNAGRVPAIAPDSTTGPIVLSPNSQALVYGQSVSCTEGSAAALGKSYVVRVDLPAFKQTTLLESETPSFRSVRWETLDELRLFDEAGKEWRYNFANRKISPAP